jgi:hypothetical protein
VVTRTELITAIETVQAQLMSANETYSKLLAQDMAEYRFHSGEGTQWVIKRKLKEITETIDYLESRLIQLEAKLNGTGLVNFTLRRQ